MRPVAGAAKAVLMRIPGVIAAVGALAALYGWALLASTPAHPGAIGVNINALGTDWMVFYGAAQWFFDGRLGALFDGERLTAYLNAAFAGWLSQPMPYRPWVYPPSYLLMVLPFGRLGFAASYAAFQAATAGLLGAALYFGADRPNARALVIAASLLGPAAAINAAVGQNAFLTAALLVGGFRLLPTQPALGGAVLGLLTYKPQFWLLIPVALAAGRAWKALAWSVLAAVALAATSLLLFGAGIWRQWLDFALSSYADPAAKWVVYGRMAGDSVYACLVAAGASEMLANAAQAGAIAIAAGFIYAAFRLRLPNDQKIAIVLVCTILAAPHSSLHEAVLLAIAAALWIGEAAQRPVPLSAWPLALSLWLTPLINPPQIDPLGRLTPVLLMVFAGIVVASARRPACIGNGAVARMASPG
jgi:alpha-1,2-mannosyltransferase